MIGIRFLDDEPGSAFDDETNDVLDNDHVTFDESLFLDNSQQFINAQEQCQKIQDSQCSLILPYSLFHKNIEAVTSLKMTSSVIDHLKNLQLTSVSWSNASISKRECNFYSAMQLACALEYPKCKKGLY